MGLAIGGTDALAARTHLAGLEGLTSVRARGAISNLSRTDGVKMGSAIEGVIMGWGELRKPDPGEQLAAAVREWDRLRTTGSEDRLRKALSVFDARRSALTVSIPEPETGRRSGW